MRDSGAPTASVPLGDPRGPGAATTSGLWRLAAAGLVALVLLRSLHRAATQSITHDEALTYLWFLSGSARELFQFDANNHPLLTLLAKLSTHFLGVSEVTFRLPSVLAAALYAAGILLLCRDLFGRGGRSLLAAALATLNPFVLDFFSLARGYGLALAFFAWGQCFLVRTVSVDPRTTSPWRVAAPWLGASLAFGLSVSASLAFLLANASLAVTFLGAALPEYRTRLDPRDFARLLPRVLSACLLPGPLLAAALLAPFLASARAEHFYAGHDRALDAIRELVNASFFWKETAVSNLAGLYFPETLVQGAGHQAFLAATTYGLVPMVLAAFALVALRTARARERTGRVVFAYTGAVSLSWLSQVAFHHVTGLKYPADRMALYAIPLLTLAGVVVAGWFEARLRPRAVVRAAALLVGCVILLAYAGNSTGRTFDSGSTTRERRPSSCTSTPWVPLAIWTACG